LLLNEISDAFSSLPDNRTPTQADWEKLSAKWRNQLDARIHYLERLRDSLTGCIGCGCLSMKTCPLYNDEDHLADKGTGAVILNKDGVPE